MTTGAGVTPIRCRNLGTPDEIRARGRCFLGVGIVFIIIGIALLCVSFATVTFVIGPSIVIVIWGVMCLFIAWKRFQLAGMVENNATHVPTVTISSNVTTQYTSHPTVTVFQQSTATSGSNYGFQQQQYPSSYPGQFTNTTSTYSPEAPPYSSYNTYSTPTSPPSYNDAVNKS